MARKPPPANSWLPGLTVTQFLEAAGCFQMSIFGFSEQLAASKCRFLDFPSSWLLPNVDFWIFRAAGCFQMSIFGFSEQLAASKCRFSDSQSSWLLQITVSRFWEAAGCFRHAALRQQGAAGCLNMLRCANRLWLRVLGEQTERKLGRPDRVMPGCSGLMAWSTARSMGAVAQVALGTLVGQSRKTSLVIKTRLFFSWRRLTT